MKFTPFLSVLCLLSTALQINAQELKQYQGTYESGKATYQYFETQSADRIYQGHFKYRSDLFTYEGDFDTNLRTGAWKISAYKKNINGEERNKIRIISSYLGVYDEGSPEGLWKTSYRIQFYNPRSRKLTSRIQRIESQINFKKGIPQGAFQLDFTDRKTKQNYSGKFDLKGYPDSIWVQQSNNILEKITYKHGMIYARWVQDIQTGDKVIDYDSSDFIAKFWKNYDQKNKLSIIQGKLYILDTITPMNPVVSLWSDSLLKVPDFGEIKNPLFSFQRGQKLPNIREISIIPCDSNTSCFKDYQFRQEQERLRKQKIADEAEQKRLEELRKKEEEERLRLAKEQAEERKKKLQEGLAQAQSLLDGKEYKKALKLYQELSSIDSARIIREKMQMARNEIFRIDSLHQARQSSYEQMQAKQGSLKKEGEQIQKDLLGIKKSYAKNFELCQQYLYPETDSALVNLSYLDSIQKDEQVLERWTDKDELSLIALEDLRIQQVRIQNFQNAVRFAMSKKRKAHLRVLNSSLNPEVIVRDMISFEDKQPK
ncbi:MAG: hypothetical protein EP338_09525 [Bacteroidetes bacterium]|nr:MAG: hypothetical protein EP338_09525 [Bacteroidota bacterium]